MRAAALTFAVVAASLLGTAAPSRAAACGAAGTPTTTLYLPNITKTLGGPSGWVTPFIVQNVGATATTLEVSFYRFSDGSLVTCRSVPGLLPGTSFADVPNNDADLPDNSQFAVVVRSFGSQVVSVVNEHQGSGTRAEALSYVGPSAGATSVALPWLAKGARGWLTTFIVQNVGIASATVTVSLRSLDGARTATLTRTVAPGRSAAIDPTVESAIVQNDELSATVTSTQPIAVVVNAHNDAAAVPAPKAFSYNGVAVAAATTTYVPYLLKEDLEAFGPGASQVYLQNVGLGDATPTLTFKQIGTGTSVSIAAPAPVKPGATWAFDPQIYKIVGGYQLCRNAPVGKCIAPGEHSLVVTGGAFAVLNAAITTTTAMGFTGTTTPATRLYLPNITRTLGGATGWTTPIVLGSAGATSATVRWYRFADGTLAQTQSVAGLASGASVKIDPRSVAGLADNTQYAVVVEAAAPLTAVVLELSTAGGDGAMAYEGFPITTTPVLTPAIASIAVSPATATVATGGTQQFTATAKDASGVTVSSAAISWSVTPATAGTITAAGLFTAGATAGTATITATSGTVAATATVTIGSTTLTRGGFTFTLRATSTSDVYVERTITTADADTIAVTVDADVAQIQKDYARTFQARPQAYVFPTTAAYTTGLETVMGLSPAEAAGAGAETCGLFRTTATFKAIALNWAEIKPDPPYVCPRHELTHAMIEEIAKPGMANPVPAWVHEGNARLEEFTVSRTTWWKNKNRYSAASMVAVRQYFQVAQITDLDVWNARSGLENEYQYYEASQVAQLVRDDVGMTGMVRMLELMGQGQTFDAAYATVAARTLATFTGSVPARLQAISAAYPYAVTAADEPGGNVGLSYILYGFQPNSTITLDIRGVSTGYYNTQRTRTANAYGVSAGYLGTAWPADTYRLTVTGITPPSSTTPGTSVTFTISAVKSASVDALTLTQ